MAYTYCTATNFGKNFFTHDDRTNFYLSGHPGNVWVVGNNNAGISWINRVEGTAKVKADAQAIVDAEIEKYQAEWDGLLPAQQTSPRPVKYILPQELTMANYKGIKGFKVQSLASDPSNVLNGQVWYNTAGAALKVGTQGAAGWSSGGALNTTRYKPMGAGTQTAAICMGGAGPPGTELTKTETYDGSTWTEITDIPQIALGGGSAGTESAAACFSGGPVPVPSGVTNPPTETFEWNGSAWSAGGDINVGRWGGASWGAVFTACGYAGGTAVPGSSYDNSEEYNGTSWTEGDNLTFARRHMTGVGPQTAALIAGGVIPGPEGGPVANAETYDGTSWSASTAVPFSSYGMGAASQGTQTAGFWMGGAGSPGPGTGGILWNGSAWSATPNMSVLRDLNFQMPGTSAAAIIYGANPSLTTTEEYNDPAPIITKTVTIS